MLDKSRRREAITAYKERAAIAGVFALRCKVSGAAWVGASPTLDKAENRLRFSLNTGRDPHKDLQAAWSAHGEAAFEFVELERLDDAVPELSRKRLLDEMAAKWAAELAATLL